MVAPRTPLLPLFYRSNILYVSSHRGFLAQVPGLAHGKSCEHVWTTTDCLWCLVVIREFYLQAVEIGEKTDKSPGDNFNVIPSEDKLNISLLLESSVSDKSLYVMDVYIQNTTATEITYLCSSIWNPINTVQQNDKKKNDNFMMRGKDWLCA